MRAGGLLDEPVLVVAGGWHPLARLLIRQPADTEVFAVTDGAMDRIGQVEPTDRDPAGAKAARFAFALVAGGYDATRRSDRKLRLAAADGSTVLQLHIQGSALEVRDAAGGWIGIVNNHSSFNRLKLAFHTEPARRRLIFKAYGDPAASIETADENPPYDIRAPHGGVLAQVTSEGILNRLEWRAAVDERLRDLVVGFACGLVDRVWLRRPDTRGHS